MAIWLTKDSKVIVQGMTGSEGSKHTRRMLKAGTNIVGGVNPRKAGTTVEFDGTEVPVFGSVADAFRGTRTRFLLVSFTSDWLFPTSQSRAVVRALNAAAANVSFVEIESDKGHDAFLLDEPDFHRTLAGFIAGCAEHAKL